MKVFIFKSCSDEADIPDKFEIALKSENIFPEIIPVISFKFCNLENLWQHLQTPDSFSGIIFSSPRCVLSFEKCTESFDNVTNKWESSLKIQWAKKSIFCIGPATLEAAINIFGDSSNLIQSDESNSESFGHQIIKILGMSTYGHNLPLLYPCGNLKKDTLGNVLSAGNIKTTPIVVYETVQNPNLQFILSRKDLDLEGSTPYVFFSPSGINFTLPYLYDFIIKSNRPLIAIGPTTRVALLKINNIDSKSVFQCKNPTPESLLDTIKGIYEPRKCPAEN